MSNAHDTLIGQVPSHLVKSAHLQLTAYEGRVAEFNVAAWLQLPGQANNLVSLLVSYLDGGRRREVNLDHAKVSAHGKILLSGIARLPVKQRIEDMQVRLRAAAPKVEVVVEELFVQAVEPAQAQDDSRQANG
ncbi:hypothetical protein [Phytopseudomonas dryadis]|uniref:Uncharacterized protein n=1 Tax=Phytopseudomonas dryadis TaxID=2487520 RepID=A0A4V2KBY0_9GAMM|nr:MULTISPECIES: hypothetical protein [Pseudomonas]TBU89995.1 hypothetical protein DNK44_15975 [Pseudomonas dryadis]TBV02631.1 hypothetical protein DNK34_18415 [Pseudomonas dryadis]TBV15483.1 hypothetical protein DNK41_17705 [Pseudomonas sp. FRB 230]